MFAMITTEEYKELIQAQKDAEFYRKCYTDTNIRLKAITNEFNDLLLMVTNGKKKVEWTDNLFNYFDLASGRAIAEYINEKYNEGGMLILKENDND
jgi:hypothetical protein